MFRLLLFLVGGLAATLSQAENNPPAVLLNPFSKPDLLKQKPVRKTPSNNARKAVIKNEAPVFRLSATLISVNAPMAVVNGILLPLGEEIDGMRLLLVDEGRAVLRYEGKKYQLFLGDAEKESPLKDKTFEQSDSL